MNDHTTAPAADRLFALIASIPGSGSVDWCDQARALLAEHAAAALPSVGGAALRDRVRRAVCEAEGFAWDSSMLEPDEYGDVADAVLAVLPAPADRAAALTEAADDGEGDELVCVDMCGNCEACGMEPFGTPAEGWRQAARFLRRSARTSGNREGALHGARMIEAELRRLAGEAAPDNTETPVAYRSPGGLYLYCTRHTDDVGTAWTPLASDDLPDGGLCSQCGADVLITP